MHLLTAQEALQGGVHSKLEDAGEEPAHDIAQDDVDNHGDSRGHSWMESGEGEVSQNSRTSSDEHDANDVDHASQNGDGSKSQCISKNEEECLLCRSAEVRALQGDLDVGVFVEELDALLKAPDEALKHLEDKDHYPILLRLGLLLVVLEHVPDELDEGDDEGAKGHRAQMVAEDHPK